MSDWVAVVVLCSLAPLAVGLVWAGHRLHGEVVRKAEQRGGMQWLAVRGGWTIMRSGGSGGRREEGQGAADRRRTARAQISSRREDEKRRVG